MRNLCNLKSSLMKDWSTTQVISRIENLTQNVGILTRETFCKYPNSNLRIRTNTSEVTITLLHTVLVFFLFAGHPSNKY